MTELEAKSKIKVVQLEAVVLRGDSGIYGPPGERVELGVISDSRWHRWDPRGIMAGRRIKQVNKRMEQT